MARSLLTLFSFILLLAPVLYGLYLHSFDVQSYVYPNIAKAGETLAAQSVNIRYEGFEVGDVDLRKGVLEVRLALSMYNPSMFTVSVEELAFNMSCAEHGEELGQGVLREVVEVPPGESRTLVVDVSLTALGVAHIVSQHSSIRPGVWGGAVMSIDFTANVEKAYIKLRVEKVVMELRGPLGSVPIHFQVR